MPYVSHVDYRKLVEEKGKRCPACNTHKQAKEFSVARDRGDGRAGYCRACMKAKYKKTRARYDRSERRRLVRAAYAAKHPERVLEQSCQYRKSERYKKRKNKRNSIKRQNYRLNKEIKAERAVNQEFDAVTAAMDKLYPSHFVRDS